MERIFDDDPDAVKKLTAKLEGLLKEKVYWKALKPVPRTYQHNEPDGAKRSYILPNLNQTINGLKKRIKKLELREAAGLCVVRKATFPNGQKHFYYQEVKKEE